MRISQNILEVLQPADIQALLAVQTVLGQRLQQLSSDSELLGYEAAHFREETLREGFDERPDVVPGGGGRVDVQSVLLDVLVVGGEVDVGDFEALGDDCVDGHRPEASQLGQAHRHLVHLDIRLLLCRSLVALFPALEGGGRLDVRQQAHVVIIDSLRQLHQSVLYLDLPPQRLEELLVGGQVGQVLSFLLDLMLEDCSELVELVHPREGSSWDVGKLWKGKIGAGQWEDSIGYSSDHLFIINGNQIVDKQQSSLLPSYLFTHATNMFIVITNIQFQLILGCGVFGVIMF